jgi:hypothetical protein
MNRENDFFTHINTRVRWFISLQIKKSNNKINEGKTFHLFPNSSLFLIPGHKRRELIDVVLYSVLLERLTEEISHKACLVLYTGHRETLTSAVVSKCHVLQHKHF